MSRHESMLKAMAGCHAAGNEMACGQKWTSDCEMNAVMAVNDGGRPAELLKACIRTQADWCLTHDWTLCSPPEWPLPPKPLHGGGYQHDSPEHVQGCPCNKDRPTSHLHGVMCSQRARNIMRLHGQSALGARLCIAPHCTCNSASQGVGPARHACFRKAMFIKLCPPARLCSLLSQTIWL